MARNGAGTYSLYGVGNPVITGTTISSTWANNTLNDIATALTQSIAVDGQSVITGNIPMAGFKITGLGAGTNSADAATIGSPTFTGTPAAPTAAAGTSTTQIATTAFAAALAFASALPAISASTAGNVVTNNGSVGSWTNAFVMNDPLYWMGV